MYPDPMAAEQKISKLEVPRINFVIASLFYHRMIFLTLNCISETVPFSIEDIPTFKKTFFDCEFILININISGF